MTRIAIDEANAKLADLDSKTERYLAAIEEGGEMRLVTQRLREIEQQQDSLREVVRQKRNELAAAPKGGSDFGSLFAEDVKAALNDKSAVKERHRISTALNRLLTKVVWSGDGWLMFHTRDGNMIARTVPRSALERAPRKDKKSAA